jgi:hypothetical protein
MGSRNSEREQITVPAAQNCRDGEFEMSGEFSPFQVRIRLWETAVRI